MNQIRRIFYKIIQSSVIKMTQYRAVQGRILMLHQIGREKDEFSITPEEFESLALVLNSKHTIRLEEWEKEDDFYALTIDDVPEGFYLYAFPILQKYQIPFTIFVSISFLNAEGYISTKQLLEMSNSDLCTVGSHGVRHEEYYKLDGKDIANDLKESKRKLSELIGKPVELFAYPYGSYYACGLKNKKQVLDVYKYGFGTAKCPITKPLVLPKYFLPRINVDTTYIETLQKNEEI